ncbi:predicted protein [Pyrenophora tritici-repentis Pt-1C-BFP]|uniref:Uncharacterized protein n=1 Tax=Pyrenophora tritici-repentis (strain Pt-1C-BFP) TaxID=426418 RepID=B2WMC4_PYRTR|nr:uncharacterized protein PTRG_11134 [Pyrenophora tritici-repentis Pt-1C-BFP]EDU44184.1 predicted protein [Pyrenophora tritici-repentis Pt-1C-BFP]
MSATKPDPDPAPFPFLRLPAEIRNRVYDFATQEMEGKTARLFPKPTPEPNILDKDLQPIESIGLMGVCQQILSILAREDTFVKLAPVPILKIRLDHVRKARGFSLNKWRILLQNEGDKLTSDQEMKVKELCQALSDLLPPNRARGTYRWGVHDMNEVLASRNLADVHVKVNNSKGQFMTKYVWQGERNTMTKKGVGKGK